MDISLFNKHLKQVKKQKDDKEEIISIVKEGSGIILSQESITVSKKEIKLNTTSTIKQKLFQKNIKDILKLKGFSLKI